MPAMTLESSNLFIVADGMGGQQAGEQASLMAVDLIPRAIQRRLPPDEADPARIKEAIRDAVAEVNQEILGSSGAVTEFSNMGTTVVLAQFRFDRVFVAGIGDSRAYRLREGRLEQLTKDHSLADALLDAGTITVDELANHKFKNVLYLYLGSKDARGGPEEVRVLDVRPGDRLLMASDGLTGVVPDKDLVHVLGNGRRPAARRCDVERLGARQRFERQCDLPDHSRGFAPGFRRRRRRCGAGRRAELIARPARRKGCPAEAGSLPMRRLTGGGPGTISRFDLECAAARGYRSRGGPRERGSLGHVAFGLLYGTCFLS